MARLDRFTRRKTPIDTSKLVEIGSAGMEYRRWPGGEEYNRELAGQTGIAVFDQMRRNDASIKRALKVAKIPVLAGKWTVLSPVQHSDNTKNVERDEEIRDFVEWNLFRGMDVEWTQFLSEALTMLEFGYSFFEKLYENRETPWGTKTVLKEMAPRSVRDVLRWWYDDKGRPESVEIKTFRTAEPVFIPYEKLITFTIDKEANNVEGISALRSMFKHWFIKEKMYNIDAIQKERHSVGVPIIGLPPGAGEKDREDAAQTGRNLRTNEQAHIVKPHNWEIEAFKIEGQPVDPLDTIRYHDVAIEKNVMADFFDARSNDAATVQSDLFLKGTRYTADLILEGINRRVIPELVRYNYSSAVKEFPHLSVRRISEEEALRTLTFAIRNLVGADVIRPDDMLETHLREELFLPGKDESTEREVMTPQLGNAGAGPPRQGPPSVGQGANQEGPT